jgi:NADPH-dependent 2,4-dienoyl-CoA reductase/sulfur reductase-like enzyme
MAPMNHILVVGASLAGLHAATSLRHHGHDGAVTVIGAEPHAPYDRPPLSKQLLAGRVEAADVALDTPSSLDVDWHFGVPAAHLDIERRRVVTADGVVWPYDGLVIATGASARWLAPLGAPRSGVHVLRTLDDSLALRRDLDRDPRVVVVGAGFVGLEVAATARSMGLEVTVLEALDEPLARAVGGYWGLVVAGRHRAEGVDVRLGVGVAGLVGTDQVEGVRLEDASVVPADVVVVGVGARPETAWLDGSGVDINDGVRCDSRLRVLVDGRARPDVVAAGDVARWWHPGYGAEVRVEHWTNAVEQGEAAARALLTGEQAAPFAPVPYFWSDQYGTKIQFLGRYVPGDEWAMVDGAPPDPRCAAVFGRAGRVVAALGFGRPAKVMGLRRAIEDGAPFPPVS